MKNYMLELYDLLAAECNCEPLDFVKTENVLTVSKLREGRRAYDRYKYFFHMVTTGDNAVITADECLHPFYGDVRFPNAICCKYLPDTPDRLAVCAYDGEKIMGMAGASEDAPGWLQIGVDVLPEYRSKGVGTFLVTLLKNKIEDIGNIPFYGTSVSNYHSWNIAINSGFYPAWVELGAKRLR